MERSPRWRLRWQTQGRWLLLAVVVLVLVDGLVLLMAERVWFQTVNYEAAFWLRLHTQVVLAVVPVALTLAFTWGQLRWAQRLKPLPRPENRRSGLGLLALLGLSVSLSLLVGVQLFYQGQVVANFWPANLSLYATKAPAPLWPSTTSLGALAQSFRLQPWQLVALGVSAGVGLIYPYAVSRFAALLMSLGFGLIACRQWPKVLLALNPTAFQQQDPMFGHDIGFYIFRLPLAELVEFWLLGTLLFTWVTVCLVYLLADGSLSRGRFYGFSGPQRQHLNLLGGLLFFAISFSHWLGRYDILYSQDGVVYGAGYTDVHVLLPARTALALLTFGLGLLYTWRSLRGGDPPTGEGLGRINGLSRGVLLYLLVAAVGVLLVPQGVQRVVVQPNELDRERPYIGYSIDLTRAAFDLKAIAAQPFDPSGDLTVGDLRANELTLSNVRLWDTRPLLESNRQLQQIRLYYEFKDADVDRYTILGDPAAPEDGGDNADATTGENGDIPGNSPGNASQADRRQVMVSARELNYSRVPDIAKTWVNEHLVYTHGYGFTMSPVNTANPGGLPTYFVRGIDHATSSEGVRRSIPIGEPRIYFGELTDTYVLTHTRVPELDYPSGDANVYTTYRGRGGVPLGHYAQRLLFARRLRDWRLLFTADVLPDTRLLYRRSIVDRVQAIAPFLRFDTDPYLVVADLGEETDTWGTGAAHGRPATAEDRASLQGRSAITAGNFDDQDAPNYLYWVIDAYTVSDRFPYSDPSGNDFNYIRNSVKVVVDAYNGAVRFYVTDPDDPILQSWGRLLPGMFQPLDTMPPTLRAHIRYPQDLFQVQSDVLMTYHMLDPQVFYNREDQWRAPNEIYDNEAQRVQPYYLIMKLPEETTEEFILLRLFTPAQRNNLVAWLAARSDGDRYGLRLLYSFPKQELVFGPEQIEARINQDPAISQRISLWNTQGSKAQQGNLLVIPIEQSLLYVEPLYLVAEQNQLPALARVITVYQNRIAMGETLLDTLSAIFVEPPERTAPILRELEQDLETDTLLNLTPDAPAP